MSAAPVDLDSLYDRLRDAGLRVGITEVLRLGRVLDLEASLDVAALKRIVAGVVAKSAEEVEEAGRVVDRWRGEGEAWLEARRTGRRREGARTPARIEGRRRRRQRVRWRWLLVIALALSVLETGLFRTVWPRSAPVGELKGWPGPFTAMPAPAPDGEFTPLLERPGSFQTLTADIRVMPRQPPSGPLAALLALTLWSALWLRYRNRSWLPPPAPVANRPGPLRVLLRPPESRAPQLLLPAEEEALVWGIERFVTEKPGERLDVGASVAATARHAGRPVLEFERARHHREVWLWCDASAGDPSLARLAGEMAASLEAAGLVVERADFWGVPYRLVAAGGAEMAPNELDERRDAAIVAVLTDGRLLALELESAERRRRCEALLRELSLWPRLAAVDFGDGRAAALVAPRRIEAIRPSEAFAFLGGVRRPDRRQVPAAGDLLAWAAACALPDQPVSETAAHRLRHELGLEVSPWGLRSLLGRDGRVEDRLSFAPEERARLLKWLLFSEAPAPGGIAEGSLFDRALELWDREYAAEESARRADDEVVPWIGTPAEQRLRLDRALLGLWRQPEAAAEELYALFKAGHREAVRRALRDLAPADRVPTGQETAVHLPWPVGVLPARVQVMLHEMGLGERWRLELPRRLHRPGRLWLALALCAGLAAGAVLAAFGLAYRKPTVTEFNAPDPVERVTVSRVPGTARTWRVEVPRWESITRAQVVEVAWQPYSTTLAEVSGGSNVEVVWQEDHSRACTESLSEGAELWRCGYLPPPALPAADRPARNVAVLEASPDDPEAAELAAWLLDSGSVSEVLIALDWRQLDWTSADTVLMFGAGIVVSPEQRPGLAAVRSDDWRGLADALEFDGVRIFGEVWTPFSQLVRGDRSVWVAGILNRPRAARVNAADGSVLVHVPAGEYTLGADDLQKLFQDAGVDPEQAADWADDSEPIHRVNLTSFWIGKHPITNAQYRRFMAERTQQAPEYLNDERFNQDLQPVIGVSWHDAAAYCKWAGTQLPSETQWEAAARGTDQRRYPWGDDPPTEERADFDQDSFEGPAAVDAHPLGEGPYGTLGQAGNVWEWCIDVWDPDAYRGRDGQTDPVATEGDSGLRVLRGGSWFNPAGSLAAAIRLGFRASYRGRDIGFRCVLPVPAEPGP